MDNTYIIEKEDIIDVLEDIEAFEERMKVFIKNHPQYSRSIIIRRNKNKRSNKKWVVELNVLEDGKVIKKIV